MFAERETLPKRIRQFSQKLIAFPLVCLLAGLPALAPAQDRADEEEESQQQDAPADIGQAWDELLADVVPKAEPDPALIVEQRPVSKTAAGDFLNHFFFQAHTEYIRQDVRFSGRPTVTGVFDGQPGEIADLTGIPFHEAFQPSSDHLYSFMNLGTRGWLSPHVNTNFSFRYRQDLTHVELGSPTQSVLNTFGANRRLEMLSGFVEITDLASRGTLAGSSLQIGRQFVHGAEIAALDGASFTTQQRRFSLTLFGGRRFTYYSDPEQRAIGGANIAFQLPGDSMVEYQTLFYVRGSHRVVFRKRFEPNWIFKTDFKMIGGSPVDYSAQVMYLPPDGKSTVRLSFFQKLSDKDFFYDYTVIARDRDTFNRLTRLNLGPLSPFSQFMIAGRREITPRLRLGGTVWIRRLNDPEEDQAAFLAPFEDYRFNAQTFPLRRLEVFLEFHQRNTDRLSPLGTTEFDDVRTAGETRIQDFSAEFRRSFGEGRVVLQGGAFYRGISLQNRFFFIENERVVEILGGVSLKLDPRTSVYLDYSLDDDYFIFRPSIQRAQVLRLGLSWRY